MLFSDFSDIILLNPLHPISIKIELRHLIFVQQRIKFKAVTKKSEKLG